MSKEGGAAVHYQLAGESNAVVNWEVLKVSPKPVFFQGVSALRSCGTLPVWQDDDAIRFEYLK